MEALLLMVMGLTNIACFLIGAKVGQKVVNGEEVEMPNPVKAIKVHQAKKEAEFQQSKVDTILENIDNYDGTGYGQKDVPRG